MYSPYPNWAAAAEHSPTVKTGLKPAGQLGSVPGDPMKIIGSLGGEGGAAGGAGGELGGSMKAPKQTCFWMVLVCAAGGALRITLKKT